MGNGERGTGANRHTVKPSNRQTVEGTGNREEGTGSGTVQTIRLRYAPRFFEPDPASQEASEADEVWTPFPSGAATPNQTARGRTREPSIFDQLRDHRSKPIPAEVRELADEITKDCTNEISKARAIYDWLTSNITYDTAEWRNIVAGADDYIHPHDPASVLERGTTVCIGYAWLFDDLCTSAGLESTYLIGDVRGYRGTPDDELVSSVRHAWSAVREDGEWKLLDATWGAKQAGETEADYKARADYYFDTPPNQFVFDHLPEDADWQLLENPVPSETAFSILPNLKPAFFMDGLKLGGDYTSVLGAKTDERYRLAFGKPKGTEVVFTLGPASNGEASKQIRSTTSASGKSVAAIIPPLSKGDHLLRVYSRTDDGPFTCGADFVIHAE
jgi:transglutaminase/protease-like cytokinesis protein 3